MLLLGAVGWTYVAAAGQPDAHPGPRALLLGGVAVAYIVGRAAGRWFPVAGPGMLAAAVVAAGLVATPGAFSGLPEAPPLGYANANAALLVQAVAAVALAAVVVRRAWGKGLLLAAAAGLAATVPLLGSMAGGLLALAVVLVAIAGPRLRRPAVPVLAAAVCVVLTVAATVVLGAAAADPRLDEEVEQVAASQLTTERVTLWREAGALIRAAPLTGVGPGRFPDLSPTARGDRDLHWAHAASLEQAAEQGIPGGLLLLALAGWGFAALAASRRPAAVVALGAMAFAALAVHGSIDYVLHFAVVPLAGAALLGVASARTRRAGSAPTHSV